jgi:hypothetical protein
VLFKQFDGVHPLDWMAPLDIHSSTTWLRLGIALVWLVFGLLFKALDLVPRHRHIVSRVVGEGAAGVITWLVAATEIGFGLWMLSGRFLPLCVAGQTVVLASMNALEIRYARDLLLAPFAMVVANVAFLSAGWYVALAA